MPPSSDLKGVPQTLVQQVVTLAAQATRRSLNEIAAGRFDEPALRELERMTQASTDFTEGRAAFAARRAPRLRGA